MHKQSIWATWMQKKYLKGKGHFWSILSKQSDSDLWREILNHRDTILPFVQYRIGNEKDINLWHDPWLNQGRLIDILGWDRILQAGFGNAKVLDFINNRNWVLPPAVYTDVKQSVGEDSLSRTTRGCRIWYAGLEVSSTGNFYFPTCIRGTHNSSWSQALGGHSLEWVQVGKYSFCTYRTLHGCLFTMDSLKVMGIRLASRCALWGANEESLDHIFYQCSYSAYVWKRCRLKMGMRPRCKCTLET